MRFNPAISNNVVHALANTHDWLTLTFRVAGGCRWDARALAVLGPTVEVSGEWGFYMPCMLRL